MKHLWTMSSCAFVLSVLFIEKPSQAESTRPVSLQQAAGNRFRIGVGLNHASANARDQELLRQHFSIVTPENCMKPQAIQPREGQFRYAAADQFVAFARANSQGIVGHCLVWAKDDRTPEWMTREGDGAASSETLLRRMESHIASVVARYAADVSEWDVVNEAIADSGEQVLRDSAFSRACGEAFIVRAFQAAKKGDPTALLIYNDYNCHLPDKRARMVKLLQSLKAQGTPVDVFGMQGHFELGDNSVKELGDTLAVLRQMNMKVAISELDIDVIPRGRWWADNGKYRDELSQLNPYRESVPQRIVEQQASQYKALFQLFVEYDDIIERVTFWNLHDGESWLNDFPWKRTNHPLLFDRHRQPKPSLQAVLEALESTPTRSAPPNATPAEPKPM